MTSIVWGKTLSETKNLFAFLFNQFPERELKAIIMASAAQWLHPAGMHWQWAAGKVGDHGLKIQQRFQPPWEISAW